MAGVVLVFVFEVTPCNSSFYIDMHTYGHISYFSIMDSSGLILSACYLTYAQLNPIAQTQYICLEFSYVVIRLRS